MGAKSLAIALVRTALALTVLAGGGAAAAETSCTLRKVAELPVKMAGASPLLAARVNGERALFIADSGAFYSYISKDAAARLGLEPRRTPHGFSIVGVGGRAPAGIAVAREFELAGLMLHDVGFVVGETNFDDGAAGLLGQNVLGAGDAEYDLAGGVIRLMRPQGCEGAALAYWAGSRPVSMLAFGPTTPRASHITASATLNGQTIRVMFDSGTPRSIVKRATAERLGFTPQAGGISAGETQHGIGPRAVENWIAPFDSFEIGGERVRDVRLMVGDFNLPDLDMLIGADFFLSHRIYVSRADHRLYFTYNGGPVFRTDGAAPVLASVSVPGPIRGSSAEPGDAAGFARRGAASAARRDYESAIADFTRAIALDPADPELYVRRAQALRGSGDMAMARADLDRALRLKPDEVEALVARGEMRLARLDAAQAQSDFDAAVKAAPPGSAVGLEIASLYARAGLVPQALTGYDAWIAAHPNDGRLAQALNGRCWTRALAGRELDRALADCDAALREGPGAAETLDSKGLALLRLGRLDEAIAAYDLALNLQPKLPWSLYGRGMARLAKGQTTLGEADIASAVALEPALPAEAAAHGLSRPGGGAAP